MSQKLKLKSDLTLETSIQIARQSEMVKSFVTDLYYLASKDLEEVPSKKKRVISRWRKGSGRIEDSSQKQSQKRGCRCSLHHTKPVQCLARDRKYLKCLKVEGGSLCSCILVQVSEGNEQVVVVELQTAAVFIVGSYVRNQVILIRVINGRFVLRSTVNQ